MKRVAVVGVGCMKIDAYPDRPEHELLSQTLKMGIDDCGLTKKDYEINLSQSSKGEPYCQGAGNGEPGGPPLEELMTVINDPAEWVSLDLKGFEQISIGGKIDGIQSGNHHYVRHSP